MLKVDPETKELLQAISKEKLLRHLAPGDMLYLVYRGYSSPNNRFVVIYSICAVKGEIEIRDVTPDVSRVTGKEYNTVCFGVHSEGDQLEGEPVVQLLSTALFGEPNLLKCRYL